MLKNSRNNNLKRIIDANLNRVKEGFRVCEEITRFILDDHKFTASLKKYRHEIDSIAKSAMVYADLLEKKAHEDHVTPLILIGIALIGGFLGASSIAAYILLKIIKRLRAKARVQAGD